MLFAGPWGAPNDRPRDDDGAAHRERVDGAVVVVPGPFLRDHL